MRKKFQKLTLNTVLIFTCIVFFSQACNKDELAAAIGIIRDTGSFSSGGCEWAIEINLLLYQPRNLPASFQIADLPVTLRYQNVNDSPDCPNPQNFQGKIHIHKIDTLP